MRVLVCGSRNFNDYLKLCNEMDELPLDENQPITIISGEARGTDTLAKQYTEECDWDYDGYPADWKTYGKAAGPIRNKQMLIEGKPDLVVAFLAKDSIGTKDMIKQATDYGVEVKVVNI